jgi:hypothetical protein
MSYADDAMKAAKAKSTTNLTIQYYEWKEKGQIVVGRLLNRVTIKSRANGGEYFQYIFDTDMGKLKFHCGAFFDRDAGSLMEIGGVYSITFQGKKKLAGTNEVNLFDLLMIKAPGEV